MITWACKKTSGSVFLSEMLQTVVRLQWSRIIDRMTTSSIVSSSPPIDLLTRMADWMICDQVDYRHSRADAVFPSGIADATR
jgi:hypothetical protein